MCLSEIKADSVDCITIQNFAAQHDFVSFCKPRKTTVKKSGGLCTLISNDIAKYVKEVHTDLEIVQWFRFDKELFGMDKDLLLGNVYLPPSNSPYAGEDMFADIERNLLDLGYTNYNVIIVGDFNAHTSTKQDYIDLSDETVENLGVRNCTDLLELYNCKVHRSNLDKTKCDLYGYKLLQLCKTTGICIFNGRVTGDEEGSYTTSKHTTIDYVIGSPSLLPHLKSMQVDDFDQIYSDVHNKVTVIFSKESKREKMSTEPEVNKINKWTNDKINEFVSKLSDADLQHIEDLLSDGSTTVNEINDKMTEVLLTGAESTFGIKRVNTQKKIFGNRECRQKKREYNKAIKKLKLQKSESNIQMKRKACREYKNAIKKFANNKNRQFQKRLRMVKTTNSGAYWKMLNNRKRDAVNINIEDLEQHFRNLNSNVTVDDHVEENDPVTNDVDLDDNILNEPITEDEIIKASKKLKNSKSPGSDNVINEYIKASMPIMIKQYVGLFNKILDTGEYPDSWSLGLIVPIYKKKGDKQDCNNYRGITLLSCVGKLFTSVVNERLKKYCDTNNIINENQAGFRAEYSTVDHILSLKALIDLFFKSKQKLYCAFIDYQKAFDTVWRNGLWYKLNKCGIYNTSKIYKVIVKMYEGIKSCVFVGNVKSKYFTSNTGVRQGENLSPMLFALYLNDLEDHLISEGNPCLDFKDQMCNNYIKLLVLLYADDTVLLSNSPDGLQQALKDLGSYCTQWKLKVNSSKTKVIIFSKRKPRIMPKLVFDNKPLEIVTEFKYLGVVFKSTGSFNSCKAYLKDQATKAMFALLSKGRMLNLPVDVMLELYDKTVLPIMLYGCEIWGFGNNNILETVFLKFCKYLLGLKNSTPNCMVYGEVGCYPVSVHIKVRMIVYWLKLCSSGEQKICKKLYNVLLRMHRDESYHSDWLTSIITTLEQNGLGLIWQSQGTNINHHAAKLDLQHRLQCQFIQDWHTMMEDSSKCTLYRNIKTVFELEPYLYRLPKIVWQYIVKFRCCNHKLEIEKGRYIGLERNLRHCQKCTLDIMGDEYHTFFECNNEDIVELRKRFLPVYYIRNRSMYNFVRLLQQASDIKIGRRIASFIRLSNTV